MSGFDDRRNDPDQQPSYGADQFDPAGSDAETAEQPAPARPWKRDSGFHEQVQWPPPGQPDPTVQWQQGGSVAPAPPNYQWQPSPGGQGQPSGAAAPANSQWQPGSAAPQRQPGGTGQQWQAPGQADPTLMAQPQAPQWQAPGQADPTLMAQPVSGGQAQQWQAPAAGRADPTLMAQPVSGGQAQQWQPPAAPGQADPTLMAQPQARSLSEPAGLWQPSLGTPEPSPNAPGEAAPTMLGYPNATRLGQPDPALQWQPAPPAPAYAAPPVYGQPVGGAYAPQSGFGGPPPHQVPPGHGAGGPPPSGRGKAVLLIGLVVLLVAGGAITAVTLAKRGSNNADSQRNSPSMVSALTTSEGAPTPSKTSTAAPTPSSNGRHETPVVPGFQVVVAPDRGAAYDVPAGWTIAPETAIGGYGEPPNAVAGKGYASDGKGYCPGSTRTASFLTGSKDADSGTAATDLGTRTAKLAYTASADARPAAPVPLESLDGTQRGMFVETKGTVTQAKPGCATAYSVYTAAFPTDNGSFVMVITADTGVPNALDADTAKRIFTSIRPHDG
ncbi:hypothetical protein AB0M22_16455 [Nocardia sp. NPDC051756]|uniref:hypothetical protein n=1 Tax=Nocardia sp. NPDC051756 TaxID=3154751 RepID=UPI003417B8D4